GGWGDGGMGGWGDGEMGRWGRWRRGGPVCAPWWGDGEDGGILDFGLFLFRSSLFLFRFSLSAAVTHGWGMYALENKSPPQKITRGQQGTTHNQKTGHPQNPGRLC
ncbi:hypothetical protein E1H13_21815, partial [Nodosilinea sp. P-1105]|nr:hypothetical protein [Nodosilinea sp. P-1105]